MLFNFLLLSGIELETSKTPYGYVPTKVSMCKRPANWIGGIKLETIRWGVSTISILRIAYSLIHISHHVTPKKA